MLKPRSCPVCLADLSVLEILTISTSSSLLKCKTCDAYIRADRGFLRNLYVPITFISISLCIGYWGINKKSNSLHLLIIFIIISFMMIRALFVKYYQVPLYHSYKSNKDEIDETIYEPIPEIKTRKDYLRYRYKNKSNAELNSILESSSMTKEAKLIAKEIIVNRKEVK